MSRALPNHKDYDDICSYFRDMRKFLKSTDKEQKFTQQAVAQHCGLDCSQYISNFERGLCLPSVDITVKLAALYGIDRQVVYDFWIQHAEKKYRKQILEA